MVDQDKTAKLKRRRIKRVVKYFTQAAHFIIPQDAIANSSRNGVVTRRLLLDFLPLEGDFHLRVKVRDEVSGPDAYVWMDLSDDDKTAIQDIDNVISVRCVPAADITMNTTENLNEECNMELLPQQKGAEISEKVEEALEQIKKDGKETLKKMANGLKAFGNLFKKKPTGFTVE